MGCNAVLRVILLREIFGNKHFASILGVILGIGVITGTVGPPLAGWVFDNQQSYQTAMLAGAGLAFLSVISIFTLPKQSEYSSRDMELPDTMG